MASDKMIQKFNEETRKEMKSLFEKILEQTDKEIRKVYNELLNYSNEKRLKDVDNVVVDFQKSYVETIKKEAEKVYREWYEKSSIHVELKKQHYDGNGLDREAKALEGKLLEMIQERFKGELELPKEREDMNMDKGTKAWINDLAGMLNKGIENLKDMKDEKKHQLEAKRKKDSHYYAPLWILVESLLTMYIKGLTELKNIVKKDYQDAVDTKNSQVLRAEETGRKEMQSYAKKIDDAVKNSSELVGKYLF